MWGPIPGQEPKPDADTGARRKKRRSRWGDKEEANEEKAIMLMPDEIVLSTGLKVRGSLPMGVGGRGFKRLDGLRARQGVPDAPVPPLACRMR